MSDRIVVIVSAVRTPVGSFNGSLSSFKAHELGGIVIKEALSRARVQNHEVSEIIFGQTITAGQGQNPARLASFAADIPYTVPAYLINMLCGSGLKSVALGFQAIKNCDSDIVVCGGQEVMSQAQHAVFLRNGLKMGDRPLVDTMLHDILTDTSLGIHMGETAENIAKKYGISREDQDKFAAESQQKAERAQKEKYFAKEIVPVSIQSRNGITVFDTDEFPRHGTTTETLQKLKPVFQKVNGTVTAGNSSGINDGAAAVVLMAEEVANSRNITPLAKIVAFAQVGVEPAYMGMGPVPAVEAGLKKAGWTKDDVDIYEINEAFAAQSVAVIRELGVDPRKVNINGGAISLGHPIAASGTRVLVTLLHALERTGGKRGVAALCIGGGMGISLCVERC